MLNSEQRKLKQKKNGRKHLKKNRKDEKSLLKNIKAVCQQ